MKFFYKTELENKTVWWQCLHESWIRALLPLLSVRVCVCVCICVCYWVYMCVSACACMYTNTHSYMTEWLICFLPCSHFTQCVCVCVCTYIQTHTHTLLSDWSDSSQCPHYPAIHLNCDLFGLKYHDCGRDCDSAVFTEWQWGSTRLLHLRPHWAT